MSISTRVFKGIFGALLVAAMTVPGIGKAVTFTDLASWEASVTGSAAVDLDTTYAEYEVITAGSAIDLAGMASMTLGGDVEKRIVGSSWATWSGTGTPSVLYSMVDTLSATFSPDVTAFGLVMEPNSFSQFTMTLGLSDGTSITQDVFGDSGAAFFGWSGQSISSIDITCGTVDTSCSGFAFGEMVIGTASVPEAGSLALLSIGLLAMGMRRRNKRA